MSETPPSRKSFFFSANRWQVVPRNAQFSANGVIETRPCGILTNRDFIGAPKSAFVIPSSFSIRVGRPTASAAEYLNLFSREDYFSSFPNFPTSILV